MKHVGKDLGKADVAMLMVHGRGASAASILTLARNLGTDGVAYVAPEAPRASWYPNSFLAPLEENEPHLTAALDTIAAGLAEIEEAGIVPERTVLLGFSQGACLSLEFAARNPRRYGGVVALSGGLLGNGQVPGGERPNDKRFDYAGSLAGTPVFLGCSDVDAHVPVERVHRSAEVLRELDGDVTKRIYEGMGHTVNDDELDFVRDLLGHLVGRAKSQGAGDRP